VICNTDARQKSPDRLLSGDFFYTRYTLLMKRLKKKVAKKKPVVVAVSGGFDPVHIGHIRMFEEAKKLGDKLIVILNNDNWLADKKGFAFMPEAERREVLEAMGVVDAVHLTAHTKGDADRSVSRELLKLKPHIFANGGDRKSTKDIPEVAACEVIGARMVFNVGGGKVQSSSWLTAKTQALAGEKPKSSTLRARRRGPRRQ
jgi:cytidyltransferase-like protein